MHVAATHVYALSVPWSVNEASSAPGRRLDISFLLARLSYVARNEHGFVIEHRYVQRRVSDYRIG
jgi:hypothetical protein